MTMSALSDVAYDRIRQLVARQGLAPHGRLPGEHALAAHCGVSRPVVRQALARLRAEGHVYSRRGAGHYVDEPKLRDVTFGPLQSIEDVRALLDFRRVLEGESAARACHCTDRSLLHTVTARRRSMDAAVARGEPGIEEDIAFHQAIALASGNRFFVLTLAALQEQTRVAVRLVRELSPQPAHHRRSDVRDEHRAIDEAIATRDPAAARAAMGKHLSRGIARLFGPDRVD
jgi:GntR family transcriptional repressor for pyruvate dehydrogenase complex